MARLHLATFKVDTAIPLGHPLCGGWIKSAVQVTEPLYAMGVLLMGEEAPIVLCAVDWTGINNAAHRIWREQLAAAAHTTPERVAVHCVHQHNAPFADLDAEKLIAQHRELGSSLDVKWFDEVVRRVAAAVREAAANSQAVSHIGWGQARVERVASNRRVIGPDGKIKWWRGSSCRDTEAIAQPEGLIDPWLRSISFWKDDKKLAVLHYYATHPMSYYGDGLVTSDFVGLAREGRSKEDNSLHIYFTGCAGNIAAGKYNDGDRANRFLLARRIHSGMLEAERQSLREPIGRLTWLTRPVSLSPREEPPIEQLEKTLADVKKSHSVRSRAAMQLAYHRRAAEPITLSSLKIGDRLQVLHLPAEAFVEYQLHAQQVWPEGFVATAAYGDGGPWYIPLARSYGEGGYEPSAAFVSPAAEAALKEGIATLVSGASDLKPR